ncbi:MAG: cysteine--tRNA ligase [Proteobacteria bacterium]|nr:cysteine--tRNA ligase [Pseudomonadota bacterium]
MLKIYNSLSGQESEFKPLQPGKIGIYICGNTVYDYCHLGHARSMIIFDVVVRYLRSQGYEVIHVRNITDIDDKIIKRALENGETIESLTERFIQAQKEDEQALGLLSPNHEPRATHFIKEMQELIQKLLDRGYAYVSVDGDVCFEVRKDQDYGKLSGRDIEKLKAGARVNFNEGKKDPLDFVLWKISKPGEPHWPSPWGEGRPGWHIECSAMSAEILGQPFDIHGGGMDLKFPHHENELAQSESACGCEFARCWMHVGLLQVNGEKMAKSLGNFVTIRDALNRYRAEELRFFMMSSIYNRPADYTESSMHEAKVRLKTLYNVLRGLPEIAPEMDVRYTQRFNDAMNDNFNTSVALGILEDLATEIAEQRKQKKVDQAAALAATLRKLGKILGILNQSDSEYQKGGWSTEKWQQIEALAKQRDQARAQKKWAESDQIRQQLINMDVDVEDTPQGTYLSRH